jgi:hypothetical protein
MSSLGAQTAYQIPLTLKNYVKVYSIQLQGVSSRRNYERNADNNSVQITCAADLKKRRDILWLA